MSEGMFSLIVKCHILCWNKDSKFYVCGFRNSVMKNCFGVRKHTTNHLEQVLFFLLEGIKLLWIPLHFRITRLQHSNKSKSVQENVASMTAHRCIRDFVPIGWILN